MVNSDTKCIIKSWHLYEEWSIDNIILYVVNMYHNTCPFYTTSPKPHIWIFQFTAFFSVNSTILCLKYARGSPEHCILQHSDGSDLLCSSTWQAWYRVKFNICFCCRIMSSSILLYGSFRKPVTFKWLLWNVRQL